MVSVKTVSRGAVVASYFTSSRDPQRSSVLRGSVYWAQDLEAIETLANSLLVKGIPLILFHDLVDAAHINKPNVTLVYTKYDYQYTPQVFRFFVYLDYLLGGNLSGYDYLFCVDSTDVECLNDPFGNLVPGTIYVGFEAGKTMQDRWVTSKVNHMPNFFRQAYQKIVLQENRNEDLINVGLVGGDVSTMETFLALQCGYHQAVSRGVVKSLDSPVFYYNIFKNFKDRYEYGSHVNTVFKAYEIAGDSWWRHK